MGFPQPCTTSYSEEAVVLSILLTLAQLLPPTSIKVTVDGCWQCQVVDFTQGPLQGISAVLVQADNGTSIIVENPAVSWPALQPVVTH